MTAPTRVAVRDSTFVGAVTTFPAAGKPHDIFNHSFTQALQQYADDRAAYQFGEAGDRPALLYSGTLAALNSAYPPGTAGRLARVTDGAYPGSVYLDTGSAWRRLPHVDANNIVAVAGLILDVLSGYSSIDVLDAFRLTANGTSYLSLNSAPPGGAALYLGAGGKIYIPSVGGLIPVDIATQDIGTSSFPFRTAYLSRVKAVGGTALVAGDIALSAGWGTTATVSAISGTDSRFELTITSSGTGQAASPTFTHTDHDGTWTTAPYIIVQRTTGDQPTVGARVTTKSATAFTATLDGTPVAGQTYSFVVMKMG